MIALSTTLFAPRYNILFQSNFGVAEWKGINVNVVLISLLQLPNLQYYPTAPFYLWDIYFYYIVHCSLSTIATEINIRLYFSCRKSNVNKELSRVLKYIDMFIKIL